MNILIIGNGFDIAHGLPTKYEHFLKYVDAFKRYYSFCKRGNNKDDLKTADVENQKYVEHFTQLCEKKPRVYEEMNELIRDNAWIDYFWNVYKDRVAAGKDGWIDFESEISRIIQTIDEVRHTLLEKMKQGLDRGVMTKQQINILYPILGRSKEKREFGIIYKNTIEGMKAGLLTDLNNLTRCLELYLSNHVEEITPEDRLPDIVDLFDINCVLSFNYTHTYKRLYDTKKDSKIEYDYIHGETKADSNINDCNLILGVDEYLEGHAKDRDNEFIQFKKFYQRIYKKTGCKYVDWINRAVHFSLDYERNRHAIHNVYIIGHSLDITDKDILLSLINMRSTKTTIFYHNQEALGNYISNLVKVLGEDDLIAKVHGENASIVLQEQRPSVPKNKLV